MFDQESTNPGRTMDDLRPVAPYEGDPGQTHTEMAHYSCPCGAIFPVSVLVSVNVATDRELAEAAVAGKLNRDFCQQCGRKASLEVPYVLHHPSEERFVFVIPETQRYRELELRSKLLQDLGRASAVPVPPYVREFEVVFGTEGLRLSLSRPPQHVALREELANRQAALDERERQLAEIERVQAVRETQLSEKELAVESQEESVTAREERLKERGEHVTRMEDSLRQRTGALKARADALDARFQNMERREKELSEQERSITLQAQRLRDWEESLRAAEQAHLTAAAASEAGQVVLSPTASPATLQAALVQAPAERIQTDLISTGEMGGSGSSEQTQRHRSLSASQAHVVVDDAEELTDDDLEDAEEISAYDIIEGETGMEAPDASPLPAGPGGQSDLLGQGAERMLADAPGRELDAGPSSGAMTSEDLAGGGAEVPGPGAHQIESYIPLGPVAAASSPVPSSATGSAAPSAQHAVVQVEIARTAPEPEEAPTPHPSRLPELPAHWVRSGQQTLHRVIGTDVNLYARVDPQTARTIVEGNPDLLIQLHLLPSYPLITLTLVLDPLAEELAAIHWIIDIEEDEDRNLLHLLRRRFRANVLLFDADYGLIDEVTFEPPREVNVAHVVDRATQALGEIGPTQLSPAQAREQFRSEWDWAGKKKHPFTEDAYGEIKAVTEAKLALGILTYWTEPQNHEYLVLVKSIPVDLLDAITRRILDGATRFGLWLSPPLRERAVTLALAPDVSSLTARLIDAFAGLGAEPPGLEIEDIADNWQRLLHDAEELDLSVSKEAVRLAEQSLERASSSEAGGETAGEPEDAGPLGDLTTEALLNIMDRRVLRLDVALELASRKDPEHLDALFRAARKMSRTDLVRFLPALLGFGEAAGDFFMEGLTSRKSYTRHACAMALGELKLRRAVVPLLHQMMNEKTVVWTEIARALGRYGTTGVKPLLRYLREPKGFEERLVKTMACFAIHGAVKQVEELASGDEAGVAALARQALEMQAEARLVEEQVAGSRDVEGQSPLLRYAHHLYLAITGDSLLEDGELLEELGDSEIVELDEDVE
jgi:hypothetical protein